MEDFTLSQIVEIAETTGAFGTLWGKYFSSLRLGQLMDCIHAWTKDSTTPLFYMTNADLIATIEKIGKEYERSNR